jgi:dethiobiotin synthetase
MNLRDLHFQKTRGLFITGTDTGVGKTLITGGIAKILKQYNLKVGVLKPIATGCREERGGLVSTDAEFLAMCAETNFPLAVITPVCYKIPAAPVVCIRAEKRPIDYEQIAAMYNYLAGMCDVVLVEGIGGVLVPLDEEHTILDLAVQIGLPAVVVARPNLGTINHSLLTIEAIRRANLPLAGVVISGYNTATAELAEETAPDIIAQFGKTDILAVVGYDEESSVEQLRIGPMTLAGLDECQWYSRIMGQGFHRG